MNHSPRSQSPKPCLCSACEVTDNWVGDRIPDTTREHYDENVRWVQLRSLGGRKRREGCSRSELEQCNLRLPLPKGRCSSRSPPQCCTWSTASHQLQKQSFSILSALGLSLLPHEPQIVFWRRSTAIFIETKQITCRGVCAFDSIYPIIITQYSIK